MEACSFSASMPVAAASSSTVSAAVTWPVATMFSIVAPLESGVVVSG